MHHLKAPKITFLRCDGMNICRAHVWNRSGYSTKTCLSHAEAQAWIDGKARALD